jgi:hypothetical protein
MNPQIELPRPARQALQRPFMEHRWGVRVVLNLPARLEIAGELIGHGRLTNASISGGFIATTGRPTVLTAVDVVLPSRSGQHGRIVLPASVTRRADGGIGVEWRDMECHELMALLRTVAADAPLRQRDRVFG